MTQEQLAHTMFPLGKMRKTEVRMIAEENGFVNANKPDSQDICFVPNGDYASIIELHTGKRSAEGNFVDKQGKNTLPSVGTMGNCNFYWSGYRSYCL